MAVTLIKKDDRIQWRPEWYGIYTDNGKRRVVNLGIPWKGTPPGSGSLRDAGDAAFERSRERAEEALSKFQDQARRKGNAAHLVEQLVELKTGQAVTYNKLADLPKLWREIDREGYRPTERYLKWCDSVFLRFAEVAPCEFLYQVSKDQAKQFVEEMRATRAAKTAAEMSMLMRSAFAAFLPVGSTNPFGARKKGRRGVAKRTGADAEETDEDAAGKSVGRKPLEIAQLETLFETAKRTDVLLYRLAVVAVFTSLRIGDVCRLRWRNVDLKSEGWVKVRTSKTGAEVEVPFMDDRIREVFEAALAEREEGQSFVFPAAARMYGGKTDAGNETRGMIYYRGKALFARAFANAPDCPVDVAEDGTPAGTKVELADVLERVLGAVEQAGFIESKKERILDTVARAASGKSYRQIESETGRARPVISEDLREAEAASGLVFRHGATPKTGRDLKTLIQATRKARKVGAASASVYGWHNLRGTFCCLAFAAGWNIEFVAKATGHKLAETMREHYFNPSRDHWRQALKHAGALIEKTGGRTAPKRIPTTDRKALPAPSPLADLAGKLADGTATQAERTRFKKLAAKI